MSLEAKLLFFLNFLLCALSLCFKHIFVGETARMSSWVLIMKIVLGVHPNDLFCLLLVCFARYHWSECASSVVRNHLRAFNVWKNQELYKARWSPSSCNINPSESLTLVVSKPWLYRWECALRVLYGWRYRDLCGLKTLFPNFHQWVIV